MRIQAYLDARQGTGGKEEEGDTDTEDPGVERAGCIACFPPIPRLQWRTSVKLIPR